MQVTLDVFSGRPNPSWKLSGNDLRQLIERLAGKAVPSPETGEEGLGYRGFIISVMDDTTTSATKLPATFRVGGDVHPSSIAAQPTALPALSPQESDQMALWLLSTTPKGTLSDEVLRHAENIIKQRASGASSSAALAQQTKQTRAQTQAQAPAAQAAAGCLFANTPYNPGFWNTPILRTLNNCYNYAVNYRSDTFAQPGRISGNLFNTFDCASVVQAAISDGCTFPCSPGIAYNSMALVIWPGQDFHWYRWMPVEGFWAHKPGQSTVWNVDNSGQLIAGNLDPSNCNRGPYTDFCGFGVAPAGLAVS
jgi:hypothetical protein